MGFQEQKKKKKKYKAAILEYLNKQKLLQLHLFMEITRNYTKP